MTSSDQPMDHVPPADDGGEAEQSELEKNLLARSTWLRLLFMIVFAFLYGLSRLVTAAVVVIQFFHVLFTGDTNARLKRFGHALAIYSFEVVDYLTFNTEQRPFPLDKEWPDSMSDVPAPSAEQAGED